MNGIHRLNTMGAQVKTTKAGKSQRQVVWSKIWHGNKTMSFTLNHLCMPSLALIWPHYYSLCSMNGFCKLCHLTQATNKWLAWVSVRSLIQGACAWPSPAKWINGQHGMYCSIYGKQCASVYSGFSRHLYRWLCLWLHKSETIFVELKQGYKSASPPEESIFSPLHYYSWYICFNERTSDYPEDFSSPLYLSLPGYLRFLLFYLVSPPLQCFSLFLFPLEVEARFHSQILHLFHLVQTITLKVWEFFRSFTVSLLSLSSTL